MPGSAFFYGPVACHNVRNIFSDKPKTFTFDAEADSRVLFSEDHGEPLTTNVVYKELLL
jgi:hypothetical protein